MPRVLLILGLLILAGNAKGQPCIPVWSERHPAGGLWGGMPRALYAYDDGAGPALYAGGDFTHAGGLESHYIARWNGESWQSLDANMSGGFVPGVRAITSFDDGAGPALYAAGIFTNAGGQIVNHIARWDGGSWSGLSGGMHQGAVLEALAVFDDGTGPALYAGGRFNTAGGTSASGIARWNGQSWSSLGSGISGGSAAVHAMTTFNDGSGLALYAGGSFTTAGGVPAANIARWNGADWSVLDTGTSGVINALAVHDDGSGPAIYAGGWFQSAGGVGASAVARWDGQAWSPVGAGFSSTVHALASLDDGAGVMLYAGGSFDYRRARWDGQTWSYLQSGTTGTPYDSAVFDDGTGPAVHAAGTFSVAGSTLGIARWSGQAWWPLGNGFDHNVTALAAFDDGTGPSLYAGGLFSVAAREVRADHIARRTGGSWHPLGAGVNGQVRVLYASEAGPTPLLYVGGTFSFAGGIGVGRLAQWNGSQWSSTGLAAQVFSGLSAILDFDHGEGNFLYVGGSSNFGTNIRRWDGQSWSLVGGGINSSVHALSIFDDGGGEALYLGGSFSSAGGTPAKGIVRWNGHEWSPLGAGVSGSTSYVAAMAVFDDGGGPALYAGGEFNSAGGIGSWANRIARWDGQSWSPLLSGLDGPVFDMVVFEDAGGSALYVAGNFTTAGGLPANNIARWDGTAWHAMGEGTDARVQALAIFDNGQGPALYLGGSFTNAGGAPASRFARLQCVAPPCYANCDRSTSEPILNVDDFTCFINEFASAQSLSHEQQIGHYANCDDSTTPPVLNVDDFTCYINAYATGCP